MLLYAKGGYIALKYNKTEEVTRQTADAEQEQTEKKPEKIKLTANQTAKKILYEILDLLKGAAFPFIIMCVFSTTIIMFAEVDDVAIQILATVVGEILLIAAFCMFGIQNGAVALRTELTNEVKRKLGNKESKLLYKTGEYAVWKGFIIGFITVIPFLIFQIIKCTGNYTFVDFMLEYACGWAIEPIKLIGGDVVPQPVYLIMIVFPMVIMGCFYIAGKYREAKRQEKIQRAEDAKRKGKKKHYYEENKYEDNKRINVDMDGVERKNKKK